MNTNFFKLTALGLAVMLTGCGGGSGGGGAASGPTVKPGTSTQSFPLQSGYNSRVANGHTMNYTISGACSGSANYGRSPPSTVPAGFENVVPALGVTATDTVSYTTPCNSTLAPGAGNSSSTAYYDNNYMYLGSSSSGNYYAVMSPPISVPVSIKVGDSGPLGTENIYTDSSKVFQLGKTESSFVVEPDTAVTAIINEIVKIYKPDPGNPGGYVLSATRQERSRITANGTLTPVSINTQSNTTAEQLRFTAR